MKKDILTISILLSSFSIITSCSNKEEEIIDEPIIEEEPTFTIENLSKEGLANCYIVQNPGIYIFKADNKFNLGEGLPVPPDIKPVSAGLIWQSGRSLIKTVELIEEEGNPYVKFEVANSNGNALIGVFNSRGEIEWSWHIWMPQEYPSAIETMGGYEVMDMNLGALNNIAGSVSSYGMLYQWGRKDPFPAAGQLTGDVNTLSAPMYDINNKEIFLTNSSWTDTDHNTLTYSISHPMEVISNNAQYASNRDWLKSGDGDDTLWGNPSGYQRDENLLSYPFNGKKTCYDPSPYGWRVPSVDVFLNFTANGGYSWDINDFNIYDINGDGILSLDDYNYGWYFMINPEEYLYFPAAARFDGSYAMLMGSMSGLWGNYWSNSPSESMPGGAISVLAFQIQNLSGGKEVTASPLASSSKADAFSIRCIRDY